MATIKSKLVIQVTNKFKGQLEKELNQKIGRAAREAIVGLHPAINKIVDKSIEEQKDNFIPSDDEAHELGIGEDGSLDQERIDGAYRGMLTTANNGVTVTSTTPSAGTGLDKVGNIKADVNVDLLFKTELANIDTESEVLPTIPWMQWLLDGAPTIEGFHFNPKIKEGDISRTGAGVMNKGGIWQFKPARPGARAELDATMLRKISEVAEREIQKSIRGL
jgi:hypothetical protein